MEKFKVETSLITNLVNTALTASDFVLKVQSLFLSLPIQCQLIFWLSPRLFCAVLLPHDVGSGAVTLNRWHGGIDWTEDSRHSSGKIIGMMKINVYQSESVDWRAGDWETFQKKNGCMCNDSGKHKNYDFTISKTYILCIPIRFLQNGLLKKWKTFFHFQFFHKVHLFSVSLPRRCVCDRHIDDVLWFIIIVILCKFHFYEG